MGNETVSILMHVINSIYHDARCNPVCRVFVPGDTRMYDKFMKTLGRHLTEAAAAWETGCTSREVPWFHHYLYYQLSVERAYAYAMGDAETELPLDVFVGALTDEAVLYGKDWAGVTASAEDRACIFQVYVGLIRALQGTMEELSPQLVTFRFAPVEGTEAEVRERVIHNLTQERLENDEMWWHIRCCIDLNIQDGKSAAVILNVAKCNRWRAWVRQAAVEYACKRMDTEVLFEDLMPYLYGKLFYWAAEQMTLRQGSFPVELARDHIGGYDQQGPHQDAFLVRMQDPLALRQVVRYLCRMRRITNTLDFPDVVRAVGSVRDIRLLDELEKLLDLTMKESFRDRKDHGLRAALVSAFAGMASEGEAEEEQIRRMLEDRLHFYEDQDSTADSLRLLRGLIRDVQWRGRPAARRAAG